MKSSKLILTLSAIIAITSLILLIVTLNKYGVITGQATDNATANLSISSEASISFVDATCDFGSGSVDEVPTYATIQTNGTPVTVDGSWTPCNGTELSNDGNVNVSVTFSTNGVTATDFIGSGASLKLMATPSDCVGGTNGLSTFQEATGSAQAACTNWSAGGTMELDFELVIPESASGTHGMIITATGTA